MAIPDSKEIQRRILNGISVREAELWLADEFEHAARLLRKFDDKIIVSPIADMKAALARIRRMLDIIEKSVNE